MRTKTLDIHLNETWTLGFCRLIVLIYLMSGLLGCRDEEIRGIFIARFADDSALFLKRIAIPSLMDREFRLSLVNKKYVCELRVSIPLALSVDEECDRDSWVGTVICSSAREIPVVWKMTSCHGRFGRSVEGIEPAFLFGFSSNLYAAQNQLELATQTKFPVSEVTTGIPASIPDLEMPVQRSLIFNPLQSLPLKQ